MDKVYCVFSYQDLLGIFNTEREAWDAVNSIEDDRERAYCDIVDWKLGAWNE